MKIKVIDLLNMISKGEEVPNKIKHWKTEYQKLDNDTFVQYRNKDGYCLDLVQILNDEVEIIEEDKPIEEIKTEFIGDNFSAKKIVEKNGKGYSIRVVDNILINKINELINKINELVKQINKLKEEYK